MNDSKLMNRAADNIRILAASMVEKANSGHPGGAMGGADFVNVLFSEFWYTIRKTHAGKVATAFPRPGTHVTDALFRIGFHRKIYIGRIKAIPSVGQPYSGTP